tara:strand:- start:121 stop:684 length:564 start_codon:yes stop_codon:yes gene_type:complete
MRRVKLVSSLVVVLGFVLSFIMSGCGGSSVPSDGPGEPPTDPEYDYTEMEPNNSLETAQFLTVLPVSNTQNLLGDYNNSADDKDCYAFFLSPPIGAKSTLFNFIVEPDPSFQWAGSRVKLWQTIVDDKGNPTGYQLLGTWVANSVGGTLAVFDIEIPYDEFYNNDLIMKMSTPYQGPSTYILDFWSN